MRGSNVLCYNAAAGWCAAQCAAQAAGRQVEIGVVEDVVELGAELDLQAFDWRVEVFVEVKVGLVERRRAARIARGVAERAQQLPAAVLGGGQCKGSKVDVLNVAGVRLRGS